MDNRLIGRDGQLDAWHDVDQLPAAVSSGERDRQSHRSPGDWRDADRSSSELVGEHPQMSTDQSRSSQPAPQDADRQQQAVAGISQVLGRVFEQLSLTSWFPAAVLVGNGAVLLQMHANRSLSLGSAIVELTAQPLGILVVLLFALVIATVITQAFEYEVIQLLEGYDWARGPGRYLMAARIRRHAAKLVKLERKLDQLREAAFEQARQTMANRHYDPKHLE